MFSSNNFEPIKISKESITLYDDTIKKQYDDAMVAYMLLLHFPMQTNQRTGHTYTEKELRYSVTYIALSYLYTFSFFYLILSRALASDNEKRAEKEWLMVLIGSFFNSSLTLSFFIFFSWAVKKYNAKEIFSLTTIAISLILPSYLYFKGKEGDFSNSTEKYFLLFVISYFSYFVASMLSDFSIGFFALYFGDSELWTRISQDLPANLFIVINEYRSLFNCILKLKESNAPQEFFDYINKAKEEVISAQATRGCGLEALFNAIKETRIISFETILEKSVKESLSEDDQTILQTTLGCKTIDEAINTLVDVLLEKFRKDFALDSGDTFSCITQQNDLIIQSSRTTYNDGSSDEYRKPLSDSAYLTTEIARNGQVRDLRTQKIAIEHVSKPDWKLTGNLGELLEKSGQFLFNPRKEFSQLEQQKSVIKGVRLD